MYHQEKFVGKNCIRTSSIGSGKGNFTQSLHELPLKLLSRFIGCLLKFYYKKTRSKIQPSLMLDLLICCTVRNNLLFSRSRFYDYERKKLR